jgi:hypothetical protein
MEPPSIVPPGGKFDKACSTTITSDVPGAKIYYTTNGSEPTQTNFEQTGPSPQVLQVEKSTTLRAMYLANGKTSQLAEVQFILEAPPATLAGNGKCISKPQRNKTSELMTEGGAPRRLGVSNPARFTDRDDVTASLGFYVTESHTPHEDTGLMCTPSTNVKVSSQAHPKVVEMSHLGTHSQKSINNIK